MRRALVVLFALLTTLFVASGSATAESHPRSPGQGRPHVTVPSAELTTKWWQTFMGTVGANSFDRCDLGTSTVVFLAGTTGGSAQRSCTISRKKAILVPLINVECSTIEGNGTTYTELRDCAQATADEFTKLTLVVDGIVDRNPCRFRVQSGLFTFTSVAGNIFGVTPSGDPTNSVSDGYWAQIGPLTPGRHTVTFGGSYPPGQFTTSVTYSLNVV